MSGNTNLNRRHLIMAAGSLAAAAAAGRVSQPGEAQAAAQRGHAYVGCRTTKERNARGEGIGVFEIDASSGEWRQVQLLRDLVNPSFLAIDRRRQFLYAVHGDFSEVSAFKIDAGTGQLSSINRQSTQGKNPVHLTMDNTNRFLTVANYATGTVAVLPVGADGALGPVASLTGLEGSTGPHKVEQSASHPHQVQFDPSRRFIVVPDKGLDQIFVYRLDPDTGTLLPNNPPSIKTREGAGPRHIDFHPTKPFAYVVNELDSTVATYRWDGERGTLEPLQILPSTPSSYVGNNRAAAIQIAPSGRTLWASNRGHDSIAIYAVDQGTGLLSPAGWESAGGRGPRFMTLDPSGTRIYVANELTDNIVEFRVDEPSGQIKKTGQTINTGSPVCILFS